MSTNPFAALGLPVRSDLTDEQVRAAWRAIAAATHPDRADGGDVARYTAAAGVGPRDLLGTYTWQLPGRIRYGRPMRLVIRGAVAALLCLGVLAVIPGDPAAPPLIAALITWFVVTGRSDLAPPRHR